MQKLLNKKSVLNVIHVKRHFYGKELMLNYVTKNTGSICGLLKAIA